MMESAMDVADLELDASTAHPEETTSQKLFSHLFEACNILRGPINQDEYKSYVTPILFFKRLSDVMMTKKCRQPLRNPVAMRNMRASLKTIALSSRMDVTGRMFVRQAKTSELLSSTQ